MKKTFSETGINGTFTGTVEVLFRYRSEVKEVHNRSTHDEEKRIFKYHRVVGSVQKKIFTSSDFMDENNVWSYLDEIEKKVSSELNRLANVPITQTLIDKLKQKGYQ